MYTSYEDLSYINFGKETCQILEGFLGTDIVLWYGRIERQLVAYIEQAEKGRNFVYRDKLDEFLRLWRDNKIEATLNREPLDKLLAAASILAVDNWTLANYFRSLRDQLKRLLASIENIAPYMIPQQQEPGVGMGGVGGPAGGAMPFSPAFGPEKMSPVGGSTGGPGGAWAGEGGPGMPSSGAGTSPGSEGEGAGVPSAGGVEAAAEIPPSEGEEEEVPEVSAEPRGSRVIRV